MPHDAWDPGLTSDIPARLMPLVTLYRPENSMVDYKTAKEAADFCGLKPSYMVVFRMERLIAHELLIRVTADLSVPDGPNYEELGLNLRGMVARIFDGYCVPRLAELEVGFEQTRMRGEGLIKGLLAKHLFARPVEMVPAEGFLARMTGKMEEAVPKETPEALALAEWQEILDGDPDADTREALRALIRIVGGNVGARGRLMADEALLTKLALGMFMNVRGSAELGTAIEPILREAAEAEGYRFLPPQEKPFFMNVKGASAAGKSTIRPQQRLLAEKLDVPWEDFALISPDYWRKYLLEYESLSDDHKYGAMLTGQELEIIDKKLDAYVAGKAARHEIPHLLIDRFRFDSFTTDRQGNVNSRLLTRFGDTVFLFFLVTPPTATVERAWKRGLTTGRFKAVDDLLYHNIEAYTGMPELFFSWMTSTDKNIHFEFLDNSVAHGERPKTIAYGWKDEMVVLRPDRLHDIDRFRGVNVEAVRPEDVLREGEALTFLRRCVERVASVSFVDPDTGAVFAKSQEGAWVARDTASTPDAFAGWLEAEGWGACPETGAEALSEARLDADRALILGSWD